MLRSWPSCGLSCVSCLHKGSRRFVMLLNYRQPVLVSKSFIESFVSWRLHRRRKFANLCDDLLNLFIVTTYERNVLFYSLVLKASDILFCLFFPYCTCKMTAKYAKIDTVDICQ